MGYLKVGTKPWYARVRKLGWSLLRRRRMGVREDRNIWWSQHSTAEMLRRCEEGKREREGGISLASVCLNHELFTIRRRIVERACGGPLFLVTLGQRWWAKRRQYVVTCEAPICTICGMRLDHAFPAMEHMETHLQSAMRDAPPPLLVRLDQALETEKPMDPSRLLLRWWRRPWQTPGTVA